jgi:Zn ribbon nucleic-acid-binding protein
MRTKSLRRSETILRRNIANLPADPFAEARADVGRDAPVNIHGLKPCPKCRGSAEIYSTFWGRDHDDVRCIVCGFHTDLDDSTKRVKKAWNEMPWDEVKS